MAVKAQLVAVVYIPLEEGDDIEGLMSKADAEVKWEAQIIEAVRHIGVDEVAVDFDYDYREYEE